MGTGLLIRDFFKEYRELRYSNSGSISFSGIENNAYRLALTLEITHLGAPRYGNLKSLPEHSHYGYVTTFKGSTLQEMIPIKFLKSRVFDITNQGIWNYHQATESLQVETAIVASTAQSTGQQIVNAVDESGGAVCAVVRFLDTALGSEESPWVVRVLGCDETDELATQPVAERYRAFPVAAPFPSIVKFKSDVPVSFLFRLEAWYLVNPAVYIADNPSDSEDATDGEDEYPEPSDGPFPTPDPPGAGRDPKDFPSGGGPGGGPGGGGDPEPSTVVNWLGTGNAQILGSSGQQETAPIVVEFSYELNGAPFVVTNGPTVLFTQTATVYYSGIVVKDRFGQIVFTKYQGVGFTAQTIQVSFTASNLP